MLFSMMSFAKEDCCYWIKDLTPLSMKLLQDVSVWNKRCSAFYNAQSSLIGNSTKEREELMFIFSKRSAIFSENATKLDATLSGKSLKDQMLESYEPVLDLMEIYEGIIFKGITSEDESFKQLHKLAIEGEEGACTGIEDLSKAFIVNLEKTLENN